MISENILESYGALQVSHSLNSIIFAEGEAARFYFQVISGTIKMFNLHESGKEFVQGVFKEGESFGEPPLFGDFSYPASAEATTDSLLFILPKERFFSLLKEHHEIHLQFTRILAKRMSYKAMMLKEMSIFPPEHRILTLIDFLKGKEQNEPKFRVDLTRQQIANLLGLRVETVIRAIKQLETDGFIEIVGRKVYR